VGAYQEVRQAARSLVLEDHLEAFFGRLDFRPCRNARPPGPAASSVTVANATQASAARRISSAG